MNKVRHIWRLLGANWEPIIALLALIMSCYSLFLARVGIEQAEENIKLVYENTKLAHDSIMLSREGIELSRVARQKEDEAQVREDRARKTAIAPYLVGETDGSQMSMGLKNHGLGPAFVYRADFVFDGKTTTFLVNEESSEADERFKNLIKLVLGNNFEPRLMTATITRAIGPGESYRFIAFLGNDSRSERDFAKFISSVEARYCYTDLYGQHEGSAQTSPKLELDDCPKPPKFYYFDD